MCVRVHECEGTSMLVYVCVCTDMMGVLPVL